MSDFVLTARVSELLLQNKSEDEIAQELGLSRQKVTNLIKNIQNQAADVLYENALELLASEIMYIDKMRLLLSERTFNMKKPTEEEDFDPFLPQNFSDVLKGVRVINDLTKLKATLVSDAIRYRENEEKGGPQNDVFFSTNSTLFTKAIELAKQKPHLLQKSTELNDKIKIKEILDEETPSAIKDKVDDIVK